MKHLIEHYVKADNGIDTLYDNDKKPITKFTEVSSPLVFGYGSYNEPKVVLGTGIQVQDIISINIVN
jgi:hypothetical protein